MVSNDLLSFLSFKIPVLQFLRSKHLFMHISYIFRILCFFHYIFLFFSCVFSKVQLGAGRNLGADPQPNA